MKMPIFVFVIALAGWQAQGQNPTAAVDTSGESFFKTLYKRGDKPLEATLRMNFKLLLKNKSNSEYQKAVLSYYDADSTLISWDIKIRTRGHSRKEICYFPPVKIKIPKATLEAKGLSKTFNELKLVNQCKSGQIYERYIHKEFMVYKLYNVVTPYSLRAVLLRLTLVDSLSKDKSYETYAMLLEDVNEMAQRLQGVAIKPNKFSSNQLEREPFIRMSVFQYMIGNTDWSIPNLHNLEMVKFPAFIKVAAVPYDFDYAGLVNTDYAVPHESLPIKNVTQRLYRGPACDEVEIQKVLSDFQSMQPQIFSACDQFDILDKRDQKEMRSYLEDFFEELERPQTMARVLKGG